MLRKLRRGCRGCGKTVRQALGCEKTYEDGAEIFSGSDAEEDDADELLGEQALREIDLLRPDLNAPRDFPSNAIRTARYTLITAIPFSLLYQFHKVSNIFFLLVAVVALIPGASPINPFSSLAPLLLVVGAGVLKDLWEDWKRHKADKEANSTQVHVLRDGAFTAVKSSEVQVGDVMLYQLGEEVRADCLILNTSLPDGLTYIETANLDGETNAKTRRAKTQTVQQLGTVEDIEDLAFSRHDGVNSYSEAMAARPVKGMCARYCGCGCCGDKNQPEETSTDTAGRASPIGPAQITRREGGEYNTCAQMSSQERASGSGGEESHNGKPVLFGILAAEADSSYLSDGIEDERVTVRERPNPFQHRAAPSETPLGDGEGTVTINVRATELHEGTVNVGDLAADEAASRAVQHAAAPAAAAGPGTGGVSMLASGLNPDLASWFGQLRLPSGETVPVTIDQFLPRGCTVRNTEWVVGVVVYTGAHTKMMLNLRPKPNKTTVLSQRLNQINVFLIVFFLVMMILVCALAIREKHRMLKKVDGVRSTYSTWYIQFQLERYADGTIFWWRFLTNFVLLSYLIPLSLYVTLEFNKAMQMLMIGADNRMAVFDAFTGTLKHARPKTSELNNQLAQVQYVFTDKTGTLTENLMTYVGGYAAGSSHDERTKPGGLGKTFLTEVMPRLMEQTRVLHLERAEDVLTTTTTATSSSLNSPRIQPLVGAEAGGGGGSGGSGAFSVAAATAAVAAALSQGTSGHSFSRGHGVGEARGGRSGAHHTADTTTTTPAAADNQGSRHQAHKHHDFPHVDEAVLEGDELFRYLRALSLCHSAVCFKAPVREQHADADDGDDDAGADLTRDQSPRTPAAVRKDKSRSTAKKEKNGHGRGASAPRSSTLTPEQLKKKEQRRARAAKRRRRQQLEQELQSRREAVLSLAAMTPRADGSRVFIPNAVPGGEDDDDLLAAVERGRRTREAPRGSTLGGGHDTSLSFHRRGLSGSHLVPDYHARTGSAGGLSLSQAAEGNGAHNMSSGTFASLHGRTGSTGWYYSRLHAHSRNATNLSTTLGASGVAGAANAAVANPLERYIDRTKIYEGQSLDEIALVSAARENGFSLYERTAKQLFVSVLGHIMCYDIIAELEFTPQRKLMSILVRRNPDGDSVEIASAASAAGNTHYHRNKAGGAASATTTTTELSTSATATTASPQNHHRNHLEGGEAASRTTPARSPSAVVPSCHSNATTHEPSLYEDSVDERHEASSPLLRANTVVPTHVRGSADREASVFDESEATRTASPCPAPRGSHPVPVPSVRHDASGASFLHTTHTERPYLLLVKGADSAMLDIVDLRNPSNELMREPLMADLDNMAKTGLRTLILGQRIVPEREVQAWLPIFNEASCAMAHRSERLHEAYAMLEKNVDLIGTTAVEDKLQEGVPETLEFFSRAGIVVWMLTGDKRETAVTIAQTSGLVAAGFADAMCHLNISDLALEEAAVQHYGAPKADEGSPTTTDGGEVLVATGLPPVQSGDPAALVGMSPEHIERRRRLLAIRQRMVERVDSQLDAAEAQCRESKAAHGTSQCVLVVDGKTLDFIFSDPHRSRRFFDLGSQCRSAVCCRMTPLQKSSIVRMFQRNTRAVALAVGDGANDVSMIQEARIGIGIMGLEGSQAELASDYAIPKFRFLKRLVFVHGRFSQYRDAHCILYSLYKNVLLTTGLCVYMFYCGFSGMSFIDSWLLAMFSVFFCSLQPLMIGILDKDVEDELAETLPALYPPLARENMYFSLGYIAKWLLDGLVEGLLFFFFIYYTTAENEDLYRSGRMGGIEDYGQIFFTMMCLVCDLRVGVIISYYMILFLVAVVFEIAMIPICELVYAHIYNLAGSNWCVLIADNLYASGKFWLFLLASCGVLAVYTMATNLYVQMFKPWINAGPAVNAVRASPYRKEHEVEKAALKLEYEQRLAVQKQKEQKALEEIEKKMRESAFSG